MTDRLTDLPEDWERALAVVAHPDDMEYGAASAVARWSSQGKDIAYVLVTDGEVGIDSIAPTDAGPLRRTEQRAGCAEVGVNNIEFLGRPDGLLEEGVALRRDIAGAIRRHRPEVVLGINHRDSWGGPSWNHPDHRVVGRCLLDAVRDAANRWLFDDLDAPPWDGVRFVALGGSPEATHGVDVTDHLETGARSLRCHAAYLEGLGSPDADAFLRGAAEAAGERLGVPLAASFEVIGP